MTRRRPIIAKRKSKTRNRRNHVRLSSQSFQILKRFWSSICKYKQISLPDTDVLDSTDLSKIQSTTMYNHIPVEIRREFESSSQHGLKCETILSRGQKVNIYIAVPVTDKRQKNIILHDMQIFLNNIIAWLNFVSDIASRECARTLNAYFLLTDAKKKFPKINTDPIEIIHANTAFTTPCSSANNIFIFRREEWFKVFMHETFHCFGLDFSASVGDESNERILSLFPMIDPKTDIRLYETFCEIWAEVFHILFCIFTTKNGKCLEFSEDKFLTTLKKEQYFSIYQSNRILGRSNYEYKDIRFKPSHNKPLYKENTQAFSYYVIKSVMLWNLDRYMKWCIEYANAGKEYPPIQFDFSHISEYCDLVDELTSNDGNYKRMVERIKTNSTTMNHGYKSKNTIRMTSIDPKWS